MADSLHVNIPNDQIHPCKDFSGAEKNTQIIKDEKGGLLWEERQTLYPVKEFIDATSAAASESNGDAYILLGTPSADWDGAAANDFVRYDSTLDTWFSITPSIGAQVYDVSLNGFWTYEAHSGAAKWKSKLLTKSLAVSSAAALDLYDTPLEVIAQPIDRTIVVIDWYVETTFATPAYGTEDTLWLKTETATKPQGIENISLGSTVSRSRQGVVATSGDSWGTTDTQLIANKKLVLTTESANPTSGNSTYTVTVSFKVV
jgi:hypothetical protein